MSTMRGGPPSPEDFQRQLSEFMRKHFPGVTNPAFATDLANGFLRRDACRNQVAGKHRPGAAVARAAMNGDLSTTRAFVVHEVDKLKHLLVTRNSKIRNGQVQIVKIVIGDEV